MENIRSRPDIKIVNKWGGRKGARMLISSPNFKRCRIFDENLAAIELQKSSILMNKPIAVGMSILDISKITMYSFLYDYLKPKYGDNVHLTYTDTDSFILFVETLDFYQDMRDNIEKFDTSDYPWPNDYNIERKNKKVPGLFKDELNGKVMVEFIGLRAKCYAVRTVDDKPYDESCAVRSDDEPYDGSIRKAKGVKKNVLKRKIKFTDYVECVEKQTEVVREQNTIRSLNHRVYSIRQKKVALSASDDKRYLIKPECINTLSWGHYLVDEYEIKRTRKNN